MFTRTVQDRCFCAFLSIVLMIPTGGGLWLYWTIDHSDDSKDLLSRLLLHVGMEIVTAAFLCGVLGILWAVFLPAWIDRVIRFLVDHFVKALAAFLGVVLAILAFTWFILYDVQPNQGAAANRHLAGHSDASDNLFATLAPIGRFQRRSLA